ncbi:MAG: hypothetical protein NTU57_05115 [Candidatus Aenigmarchaeota archaeon]|nr:hypothetical protein [Candidatus Aenigmarchaeota archaeon]
MNSKILVIPILMIAILVSSGCISGTMTDTVNADGSIYRFIEIDKTGILATANCKSLKSLIQMNQNISVAKLDAFERSCRETESSIIIELNLPYGDNENPVKIIERENGQYIRYETNVTSYLITKLKMPSKIISHNGELLDDYTVAFKGNITSSYIGYVECKKPEFNIFQSSITVIIGVVIIVAASIIIFLYKRKNKKV